MASFTSTVGSPPDLRQEDKQRAFQDLLDSDLQCHCCISLKPTDHRPKRGISIGKIMTDLKGYSREFNIVLGNSQESKRFSVSSILGGGVKLFNLEIINPLRGT